MLVSSEDELIVYLGRKEQLFNLVYPKVDIIARRINVSPDIDLLKIEGISSETIGYEVKYLKYRERWKRFNYRPIYEGLGEALSYLNYGVEKAFLVIGYDSASTPKQDKNKLVKKMEDVKSTLIYTNPLIPTDLSAVLGLRLIEVVKGSVVSDEILVEIKTKEKTFPLAIISAAPEINKFRHRKQCLLNEEFHWDKRLYDRIYH